LARILVVDDDKDFRESLKEILEHQGYDVSTAVNGNEALSLFKQDEPDLLIIDIFMPEKDGIETMMNINRNYHDVKIIAVSAGNPYGKKDLFLDIAGEIGASYTFQKPLNIEKLLEAVGEMVD